MKTATKSTFSS